MVALNLPRVPALTLAALAMAAAAAAAPSAAAQVVVSGRVSIHERPGEQTTDLDNTVIYLVRTDSASPRLRPTHAAIAMNGRAFAPRVRVVTPGSRVAFPNRDPFSHNIFSTTPGSVFDLGLYPAGRSQDAVFRRAGAVPVYCNIHPRMTAFVFVAPTPWFTQAGADGQWRIADVPAGRYKLHVWHDRTPADSTEIVVTADGQSGLTTALDARGFRFAQHKNKFGREYPAVGRDRY
jgi:plastocyanin